MEKKRTAIVVTEDGKELGITFHRHTKERVDVHIAVKSKRKTVEYDIKDCPWDFINLISKLAKEL